MHKKHQARGREQPGSSETLDAASGRQRSKWTEASNWEGLDRASQQVAKKGAQAPEGTGKRLGAWGQIARL